jgi:hypothetical protein
MRLLLVIVFTFVLHNAIGQNLKKQKAAIDAEVERISNQSEIKAVNFSIQALQKDLPNISYQYIESSKGYQKISRRFFYQNNRIRQDFYVKDRCLLYASEIITYYFTQNGKTDSIGWSGGFYFTKERLIDHITLGHGKSEMDSWNPEKEMLTAFKESKIDIDKHKKKN